MYMNVWCICMYMYVYIYMYMYSIYIPCIDNYYLYYKINDSLPHICIYCICWCAWYSPYVYVINISSCTAYDLVIFFQMWMSVMLTLQCAMSRHAVITYKMDINVSAWKDIMEMELIVVVRIYIILNPLKELSRIH